MCDEDQPNTKRNHANDPLEVPIGPLTRARAKKLKEAKWTQRGLGHLWSIKDNLYDADQPNTKHNHANDPLEVPIGPITRDRAKKLKEALNELVQNIWSKLDLEGLGTFMEHEGQPLIHLVLVQEEPNSCGTSG